MRRMIALLLSASVLGLCLGCHAVNPDDGQTTPQASVTLPAFDTSQPAGTPQPSETLQASGLPHSSAIPMPSDTSSVLTLSDFYGNYIFEEVSVVSPLSSSTFDGKNEQKEGNTYIFSENLFEISGKDFEFSVLNPKYEACGLPEEDDVINKGVNQIAAIYRIDAQYRILTEDGEQTHLKVYISSVYPDRIWIADYNDNTADGTEILVQSMDMLLLSSAYLPDSTQLEKRITGTKEGVDELLALLDQKEWDMTTVNYGYEFSCDTVYNITPISVAEGIDCRIFKCSTSCLSILVYQDECYELGIGFGGYGIVDMLLHDYNSDGIPELFYTYSWGSGLHRSCAAYFDFTVYRSMELEFTGGEQEMMLVTNENDGISIYKAVYIADSGDSGGSSFVNYSLAAGDFLCELEV